MIEFMVISAPRSGSTWASNWLTTDNTVCIHDPLRIYHYSEIDMIDSKKLLGVSCTGLFMFPEWVNNHPARKVILHRELDEINQSLDKLGLPLIIESHYDNLNKINGLHCDWRDMFDNPKVIYEFLLEMPFDEERHSLLKDIEMQPEFSGLKINKDAVRRMIAELMG